MRIDDYLSTVFLIKRRTLAKEWINAGKVRLNGSRIKAGHDVKPGDIVDIYYKHHKISVEITEIPHKSIAKSLAENYYKLVEDSEV
jgi:ribosomal 50S subunit-recycling heat shock protein